MKIKSLIHKHPCSRETSQEMLEKWKKERYKEAKKADDFVNSLINFEDETPKHPSPEHEKPSDTQPLKFIEYHPPSKKI